MNHFLDITQLSATQITALIERALYFKQTETNFPNYSPHSVATLFYETSTRTRVSFELAAKKLSMPVIDLNSYTSSHVKGETVEDTIKTLMAMGVDVFVLRHHEESLPATLALKMENQGHIINAGDGRNAHPSQAMLDMMTIGEVKPDFKHLKISIVGNIRHSRVANSMQHICAALGVAKLALVAPEIWQPQTCYFGEVTTSLQEGLADADVVICLRIQNERLHTHEFTDLPTYQQNYAITAKTLSYAKPDVMIMHPGPINRNIEIDSEIADGKQSFIWRQVTNGVYMRMAILEALVAP